MIADPFGVIAGDRHAVLEPLTRRKDDDHAFAVGADPQRSAASARVPPHQQRRLRPPSRMASRSDTPDASRPRPDGRHGTGAGAKPRLSRAPASASASLANSGTSGGRRMRQRARPVLRATISLSAADERIRRGTPRGWR